MEKILLVFLLLTSGCLAQGADKKPLTVVLSFDYEDLGHDHGGRNIDAILEMLDRRNLSVAFFVLGATAERYPERVREISDRGHLLGMHTYYHQLPIFSRRGAERIGEIYGMSDDREWDRSFKTPEAFTEDLIKARKAIEEAAGIRGVTIFRSPSMVVNWTKDEAYYVALKKAGVKVDSSVYQDFQSPRAYYVVSGVIEVPVVAFEPGLKDRGKALELAEKCSEVGVPFHLVGHPQALDSGALREFEGFLDLLEDRFDVTYLRLDKVYGGGDAP